MSLSALPSSGREVWKSFSTDSLFLKVSNLGQSFASLSLPVLSAHNWTGASLPEQKYPCNRPQGSHLSWGLIYLMDTPMPKCLTHWSPLPARHLVAFMEFCLTIILALGGLPAWSSEKIHTITTDPRQGRHHVPGEWSSVLGSLEAWMNSWGGVKDIPINYAGMWTA